MIQFREFTEEETATLVLENLDDMKRQQETLLNLMKSEGWRVFKVHMDLIQRQHLEAMLKESQPHMITALRGSYLTARDLATWPERQAKALGDAIARGLDPAEESPIRLPTSGQ